MDQKLLDSLKGMSREERAEYFAENRTDLASSGLDTANGGGENPNSSCPDPKGNYVTSWGFICRGQTEC